MPTIQQIKSCINEAAKEFSLQRVDLFGSYASGKNTKDSDIDLLVEFKEPYVSLITIRSLKNYMEEALGIDVDIIHGPLPEGSLIEIDKKVGLYGA